MASVRDFFLAEAGECLRRLDELLRASSASTVDGAELLRLTRLLRGSAQMAREERVRAAAQALETAARQLVSDVLRWDDAVRARVLETLDDLRALAEAEEDEAALDARVERVLERWRRPAAGPRTEAAGEPASTAPTADAAPADAFRAFAAREVSGILAALDHGVAVLEREPRNREPLKTVLRRQRALLGSARLDELPPVAEALRSIDEICRLIARQDVAVEGDWLALFRRARAVLADAAEALVGGEAPGEPESLAALREVRNALLARYGVVREPPRPQMPAGVEAPKNVTQFFRHEAGILLGRIERMAGDLARASADRQAMLRRELQGALTALRDTALSLGFARSARIVETALARVGGSTAAEVVDLLPNLREVVESDRPVAASSARGGEAEGAPPDGVVPVESLFYRDEALLRRVEELRPAIERALADDAAAREALAELIDLIRQGTS